MVVISKEIPKLKLNSKHIYRIGLLLFALIFSTLLTHLPIANDFEHRILDSFFRIRGPLLPPENIIVVAIDEESYRNLNVPQTGAWPRALHVKLLDRLIESGAARAVFDVLFLSPMDSAVDVELKERMSKIPTVIGAELAVGNTDRTTGFQQIVLSRPYELFRQVAKVGLVNLPSQNGAVRSPIGNGDLPESGLLSGTIEHISSLASVISGKEIIPASFSSAAYINFYGPPRTVTTFSYYQILDISHPIPKEVLQGKTVFIGLSRRTGHGIQDKDSFITPYINEGFTAGVEIHATITGNIEQHRLIQRTTYWLESLVRWGISASSALLFSVLLPLPGLLGLLLVVSGLMLASYLLFLNCLFLPVAGVGFIVLPIIYGVALLVYYFITLKEQRRLKRAFQVYLSPEMADEVSRSPEALELGGNLVDATALFTDIAGFTRISEGLTPGQTGRMLNSYFTEVMQAIFKKRGTLIKFIGDAVFALWGAPIKVSNHAQLAFEAAQSILTEVTNFNSSGRFPPLKTRIGLNSGQMLVGNLGALQRFDFTAIGDAVNLASRVEGMNKYLGTSLLMTESVFQQLSDDRGLIYFGSFKVSGKELAVKLYGMFDQPCESLAMESFQLGVEAYQQKDFYRAEHQFAKAISISRLFDRAVALYTIAIELGQREPSKIWDGSVVLESK
jgi:adenylate cyclase